MDKTLLDTNKVKRLVAISTIAQLAGQVVNALAGIVILRTLTASLGVQNYGIYATVLAFVSTFALLTDLGLNGITGRDIAKKPDQASSIIGHNMGLRLVLCLVIFPVIVLVGYIVYPNAPEALRTGILIASLYLFFDAIRAVSLAYFTAKVRNDIAAIVGVVQQVSFLVLCLFVAAQSWGLYGFLTAYVTSVALAAILSLILVQRQVSARPQANLVIWRNILTRSLTLGIIIVINTLYLKADSIMLSVLKGPEAVAIYGIAYTLILMIMAIPSYLMTALIPSLTTATKQDFENIVQKAFYVMTMFSCLLVIGGLAVKDTIVLVISNQQFAAASAPFIILVIASAFSAIASIFGFASVSVNKHHKMVYASILCLTLNIGLNFALIPHFGVVGAAWATVVSEIISVTAIYIIFHKETGVSVRFASIVKPVLLAVPVGLLGVMVSAQWQTANYLLYTLVSGTATVLLYSFLLYVTGALPGDIKGYIDGKLHRILKGRGNA